VRWLFFLLLLPTATACTQGPQPEQEIRITVTAGDTVVFDEPTGRSHTQSACHNNDLGRPQFDGRFLAWQGRSFMEVHDLEAGRRVEGVGHGTLFNGRLYQVEASTGRLLILDLATRSGEAMEAPEQSRWVVGLHGAAFAVGQQSGADLSTDDPTKSMWVYDVAGSRWLMQGALGGPGWPNGTWPWNAYQIEAVTPAWIVFAAGEPWGLWAYEIATGNLSGPLVENRHHPVPKVWVTDILGDRMHLAQQTRWGGAGYADTRWSVRLPLADEEKREGLPDLEVNGMIARYRLVPAVTDAPMPSSPTSPSRTQGTEVATKQASWGLPVVLLALAIAARRR
jgi:hypothetical protein